MKNRWRVDTTDRDLLVFKQLQIFAMCLLSKRWRIEETKKSTPPLKHSRTLTRRKRRRYWGLYGCASLLWCWLLLSALTLSLSHSQNSKEIWRKMLSWNPGIHEHWSTIGQDLGLLEIVGLHPHRTNYKDSLYIMRSGFGPITSRAIQAQARPG